MNFRNWLDSIEFAEILSKYRHAEKGEEVSLRKQVLKQWLIEKHKEVMSSLFRGVR